MLMIIYLMLIILLIITENKNHFKNNSQLFHIIINVAYEEKPLYLEFLLLKEIYMQLN